jgi:uncharacterized membrane protein YdcZ (DUF606 family)
MNGSPSRMDGRIRISAALVLLGLVIEAFTLVRTTPKSFLAFAIFGVGFVLLGIVVFLVSLVTVRTTPDR